MRRSAWMIGVALAGLTADVAAQDATPVTVDLTGRLQYQFHTSSIEDVPSTFEFRRVRIAADIQVGDAIRGYIEPDFAQGDIRMRQVWIDYAIDPALAFRAGQFKKPFSLLQLTSSLNYPTIERAVRIRGLAGSYEAVDDATGTPVLSRLDGPLLGEEQYLLEEMGYQAYDIGVAVHGEVGMIGYEAGVFNGGGGDALDEDESKAFAARATVAPAERLMLGAGVSRTDLVLEDQDGTGVAWEIDVEWGGFRAAGPHLLGEVTFGDNIVADEDDFLAAQGIAAWFAPLAAWRIEGLEPVLRGSWGDPRRDIDGDAGVLVTPGLNVYFHGRNRLMVNYDVFLPEGDRFATERSFKVQAQLHF